MRPRLPCLDRDHALLMFTSRRTGWALGVGGRGCAAGWGVGEWAEPPLMGGRRMYMDGRPEGNFSREDLVYLLTGTRADSTMVI